jgi:hypothetical protein
VAFEDLWANPGFAQLMDGLSRTFDIYSKLPPAADSSVLTADASTNKVRAL